MPFAMPFAMPLARPFAMASRKTFRNAFRNAFRNLLCNAFRDARSCAAQRDLNVLFNRFVYPFRLIAVMAAAATVTTA